MSSLVIWMISLTVGLCVTILAAGALEPQVHIAMSAMICLAFAGLGIGENRSQHAAGLSKSAIAATTAHYMGLIWAWGALAILVTLTVLRPGAQAAHAPAAPGGEPAWEQAGA